MTLTRAQAGSKVTIKKEGKGSNALYVVTHHFAAVPDVQFRSTYTKALAYRKRLIERYSQAA
jgi:hypothetical protein